MKIGQQLDIICKDREGKIRLAFEFNGIYWHSIDLKAKGYHLEKTKICEKLGIKLIHIWEDEWNDQKEEIKKLITKMLCEKTFKLEALECKNDESEMIQFDRAKINKVWLADYDIIGEIPPSNVIMGKGKKQFVVENCGYLVCKKK